MCLSVLVVLFVVWLLFWALFDPALWCVSMLFVCASMLFGVVYWTASALFSEL